MAEPGTTILLAEDDLTLSEMYTTRLQQEGFNIVHATNGEDALKLVKEAKPQAVVLDVMMPKMNGLDVLKSIKDDSETKDIPIIVVTALVQEINRLQELMGPKDSYLVKSEVMPGDIVEHIKKILNQPVSS